MKNRIKTQKIKGQTMMEYVVLVALLAVGSIPVVRILGDVFRDRVAASAHEIAGDNYNSQAKTLAAPAAGKVRRSMKDFFHQ